jgi:site-specific recombinase XerD
MPRPKQPDSARPTFAEFVPVPAALVEVVDRAKYAGLSPHDTAVAVLEDYKARTRRGFAESTRKNKTIVLRKVFTDLKQRGYDLATVTPRAMQEYRAYLKALVDGGHLDADYCHRIVTDLNATVNLLFGEADVPIGEGLCIKTFPQTPRVVDHLDIDDIEAMLLVLPERHFVQPLYREAMHTYLELGISSAGRFSSIGAVDCTFADIDWVAGTIRFRTVKNVQQHTAVLTERCLERIRAWRRILIDGGYWKGENTPIMTAERGVISYATVNEALKDLAELAGLKKKVTTHVLRKSVGNHMGKQNPRLAREQLGITEKVFQAHYNQPTVADRVERRDLLIGAAVTSKNNEERIGALFLRLRRGDISQQEFDREVNRGLVAEATQGRAKTFDPSVV